MNVWLLRDGAVTWRVVRRWDLDEQALEQQVPTTLVRWRLERLASSSLEVLQPLYESLGGIWPWEQTSLTRPALRQQVVNRLAEAFQSGVLVALAEEPLRADGLGPFRQKPGARPGGLDPGKEPQPVKVTPRLQAEYKVVLLDRKLSAHQGASEQKILADPVYVELWLEQDQATPAFDKGARLGVKGSGSVELYEDKELKTRVDLSQPLPNAKVAGGSRLKLWAAGTSPGKLELILEPEESSKPEFTKAPAARLELGVVELKSRLFLWDGANPPAQQEMSDAAKVKEGRLLHVQSADNDHARARLVLQKLDPAQWPAGTEDYELSLTDQSSGGALELFEAEWGGKALALPLKIKRGELAGGDKVLWVQGKKVSAGPREARLDIGLDRPAGGPAKEAKRGGDWARFTIINLQRVAPVDQFDAPSADYNSDKYEVLINIKADGHRLKVKARLEPALADIPLYFMLAADKDNGKAANTGVAVPAGMTKSGGGAWTWEDIDTSLKKRDKKSAGDSLHLSAKTDGKGEAELELRLSQVGGDVFRAGVYCGQDPHLASYKHGDPADGRRKPLLSRRLTVWRKLWYQLCMAKSCGAPQPVSSEAAYQRIKARLTAGTVQKFEKADLPAHLQGCTFYPQWMVSPGGGDTGVAVVGGHNWEHFRDNEATFFPKTQADEVDTLKARILVVDHQWDPAGWTGTKQFQATAKTTGELDMGGIVVMPPLQGNLIHTATWKASKRSDGSVVERGKLTDANILIAKPRTSLQKVKITLPNEADPYLADLVTYKVEVVLKLAQAESYLGESRGRHILAVYSASDVSDYNDTIAHEIGHSVKQTPKPVNQPKGMPEHRWWNEGQGVHCANPTTPTARSPVSYPSGSNAARLAAKCIMFESGPVPSAGNTFCDFCHQYLLAQDMSSIA